MLFCRHMSMWAPLRRGLWLNHFLMEMACTRDGPLVCKVFLIEFRGLNRKLYCWVWIRTILEFPLKANNVVQSISFFKHAMRLASFGTFVRQWVLPIERAGFLEQAHRCVILWHSQGCVCICWQCWIPQDGATPLYVSAQEGCKDVVEILLQNGAEVNSAWEVICNE